MIFPSSHVYQERLAATERLAAFEAHSTQMREELQALKVELQELRREPPIDTDYLRYERL
jgi:hypothetical protein